MHVGERRNRLFMVCEALGLGQELYPIPARGTPLCVYETGFGRALPLSAGSAWPLPLHLRRRTKRVFEN